MKIIKKIFAGLLLCLLQTGIYQQTASAEVVPAPLDPDGKYSVTVTTAGTFGQVMVQTVENWSDVVELTVSGHLNSEDMKYFSALTNMTKLDLSNTDITSISQCEGLTSLKSVELPGTVTTIEDFAFSGCSSLSTIAMDDSNVQWIGNSAFSHCSSLSSFAMDNVESIGEKAFYKCAGLETIIGPKVKTIGYLAFGECNTETISFPIVEKIGESAFYSNGLLSSAEISNVISVGEGAFCNCYKLKNIDLRNCETLGRRAFQDCIRLSEVVLSDKLTSIPFGCFSGAGIQQINLPNSLVSIDGGAFMECPLVSITLPSTLEEIGIGAFYTGSETCSLKDVYCQSVAPIDTKSFNYDIFKETTLHVPALSVSAYKLDLNWSKFKQIVAMDGDLADVTIKGAFTILDYAGIADNANVTLEGRAHLTVSGGPTLSLNNFTRVQDLQSISLGDYDEDGNYVYHTYYPLCTTLITNNEVRANNVTTKVNIPTGRWLFLSFPYDVKVSSIVAPEGTMWVVRKYNGANRAAMSGDTWENITTGQVLNAGEGYIFHCVNVDGNAGNTGYVEFEFPAANNSNKNNIFSFEDVVKTINEYPAEFSHNRGWNLIGNPYPSFLSSRYVEFTAPITVWNGNGYTAYSLADDEYVLRPNEAFFVQCPVNANQIKFLKEGRTHNYASSSTPNRLHAGMPSSSERTVLDFILADDSYADRTRLVLNETASYDYEIERDASKFMSSNEEVPQIYILDNGVRYAINERPLGVGEYTLGIHIGREGKYNISMNAKSCGYDVFLIDNLTDETTDLNTASYTFDSKSRTSNDRFTIKVTAGGSQSSIDDSVADTVGFFINGNRLYVDQDSEISLYSIDGKLVHEGAVDGSLELTAGVYILSINNASYKIAIK